MESNQVERTMSQHWQFDKTRFLLCSSQLRSVIVVRQSFRYSMAIGKKRHSQSDVVCAAEISNESLASRLR